MGQPAVRIGIVGDFDPAYAPHRMTNEALQHSAQALGLTLQTAWLPTSTLETNATEAHLAQFDGLWCAPGSPFQSMAGALAAIRFAREQDVPFIGTCGGCQHAILEYARHVMKIVDAGHAEYDPYGSTLFITLLPCSLVGKVLTVTLDPESAAARLYGRASVEERYYCNFGLHSQWQSRVHAAGFRVVGVDADGDARVLELPGLRFYVATVFVPQAQSRPTSPHPLVIGFLRAALAGAASTSNAVVGDVRS
jgi:CTP synthase (UTP-ammonia lyase)